MYLALLGFAMIVVFMGLIMAKKSEPLYVTDSDSDCIRTSGRIRLGYLRVCHDGN